MSYSNGLLSDQSYQTANKYVQRGLPGVGFKLTDTGDYDMQNKKLVNVKPGINNNDVVIKSQIQFLDSTRPGYVVNDKAAIYSDTGALHAESLYLKDTPGDSGNSDEIRIITKHQSYENIHLYIPDLKNYDGFGNRRRSELMVTSVDQTVTGKKVFRDIEVPNPTSNNQATNKYYVDHNFLNRITGGQIGGDLDMRGNTIKYLKLDNTESAAARVAELNLKLNRSGDEMDGDLILQPQPYPIQGNTHKAISYNTIRSIFLSRKESSPMGVDIDMNNNLIQNVATPTSSHQATNKGYCDYNFLNRQKGGIIMGPLSMNRNDLIGIPDTPKFGYSAVNKNYVDGEISKITTVDTNQFVLKSGSTMTGDFNMNNHLITNLKSPTGDNDAVNRGYLNQKISESHINTSDKTNVFKYLNDPNQTSSERNITVNSFSDWTNSPHKYNKRAYDITLQRHSGADGYDSKIGINLYSAGAGKFTLVFEFHNPIEFSNVNITASASTAIIHKQTQRNLINHTKVIIQVDNSSLQTPDYLYYRIIGVATQAVVQAHVIIYGVHGWVDSVDPGVYDDIIHYLDNIFEDNNGDMKMNKNINLDNHQIKNLKEGINSSDGINKSQLDMVSYYSKDHTYRTIFGNDFYDIIETSRLNLGQNVSGIVISGVSPNFILETDRFITDYDPNYGLKLSIKSHIRTMKILNQNSSFTFFTSFMHDSTKTFEISFSNTLNIHIKFYPRYRITSNKLIIDYQPGTYETTFTSDFQNKQLFIWICFNGSNLYKMALSNYSSHVSEIFTPPINFQSNQLEIDFDGYVKKIGLIDRFIDVNSLEHHRIMLEEKRNGSYLQ